MMLSAKIAGLASLRSFLLSSTTNGYKIVSDSHGLQQHHQFATSEGKTALTPDSIGMIHYTANVTIGGREIPLLVDTGSSDTWIFGSHFRGYPGAHDWAEDTDNFHRIDGSSFDLSYRGNGSRAHGASGVLGSVDMSIGNMFIPGQVIGVTDTVTYNSTTSGGILGLGHVGLQSGRLHGYKLEVDAIPVTMRKHGLADPIFSIALTQEGGQLAFGGIPSGVNHSNNWIKIPSRPGVMVDTKFYEENVYYHWLIDSLESVINDTISHSYHAAIDTGSPLDHISPAIASKIASMYDPPAKTWNELHWVLCGATPPEYGVRIGNQTIWYKPENMFIRIPSPEGVPDGALCLTPFAPLIQGVSG